MTMLKKSGKTESYHLILIRICSPPDSPQGLGRGFAFLPELHHAC